MTTNSDLSLHELLILEAVTKQIDDPTKWPSLVAVFDGITINAERNSNAMQILAQKVYETLPLPIGDEPWEIAADPIEYPDGTAGGRKLCFCCNEWMREDRLMRLTVQVGAGRLHRQAFICAACVCFIQFDEARHNKARRASNTTGLPKDTNRPGSHEGGSYDQQ